MCHWFYNDLRRGLSQAMLLTLFSWALSHILVWHHWYDTRTSQFHVHVTYNLFLSVFIIFNLDSLCGIVSFSWPFHGKQHKKLGNKLILFQIAKMKNEIMSSILSNILGWPGGNSSKQVCLIQDTMLSHWLDQHKLFVVCRHLWPVAD